MKKIKLFGFAIVSLLAFYACTEEDEVKLTEASHRAIVTSEMNFENKINVGGHIDFGDISSGVVSRTWTFPEGVADVSTSSEAVVKATFSKVGVHNVTLKQTFENEAYADERTTPSGSTELDTTIVVTVLGDVTAQIQANYVNADGSLGAELSLVDNAENVITASNYIRLSYTAEGDPINFIWNLPNAKPNTLQNPEGDADVRYSKVGVHDLEFIASRSRPFGGDTISIKNFIKVIPSTDPVILDAVSDKEGKVALEFSRDMDAATAAKTDFSISIETAGGTIISPQIASITTDPVDENILLLELEGERVYNNDKVMVSYTAGELSTLDAVAATSFTDEALVFNTVNMLENSNYDYSFENTTNTNWPYQFWGGNWGEYDFSLSSVVSQDGSKSAYVEFRPEGGMVISHTDMLGENAIVSLVAGTTYEVGVWIYIDGPFFTAPYPTSGNFVSDLRFYPRSFGFEAATTFFTEDFPVNEWVYTSAFITPGADEDVNFVIRGYNVGNGQTLKFYMDNISVAEVEIRP
ncbi:hypothetical protein [Cellulophaga baltica]|jgi:hypothetical protein|uniref:hypothetical protein n=1 Tax=Cellulophaga baltica TaxID=76594 RepID=UPI002494E1CC|nr:hypothetical protein [Cellulophaga baltica]